MPAGGERGKVVKRQVIAANKFFTIFLNPFRPDGESVHPTSDTIEKTRPWSAAFRPLQGPPFAMCTIVEILTVKRRKRRAPTTCGPSHVQPASKLNSKLPL